MRPYTLSHALRSGWQQQADGSFTRTLVPVNGSPAGVAVVTATDGLSPVNLLRAVRVVVRHSVTGQVVHKCFYSDLRRASRHLDLLVETDMLAMSWPA